jgi:hypothetical protein
VTVSSLIDKRIEAALDRGDIEGACLMAAKIANPAGHLAAMQIVNEAMRKPRQETPVLTFKNQAMKLSSVNIRREFAGKSAADGRTASDLRLVVKGGNDLLDKLSPHLRGSFYCHDDEKKQGELVAGALTKLQHPKLQPMLAYDEKLVGYTVTIDRGINDDGAIVLEDCAINDFKITFQEGGTVVIAFRVQFHPKKGQIDPLSDNLQGDVTVTLTPPKAEKQPRQRELSDATT